MDKIAYMEGLMKGLGVHPESREGQLFGAVCEALKESEEYIKKLENRVSELEELCSILDEDLGVLEDLVDNEEVGCGACPSSDTKIKYYYPEKEKTEEPRQDKNPPEIETVVSLPEKEEPVSEIVDSDVEEDDETNGFLDEEEYETICPTCGKVILLDEHMLEEGETVCPNCGEELEFDFDEEEIESLAPADGDSTDE